MITMEDKLKEMQKEVDELYAKEGLTDEVLNKQVIINSFRHDEDIPDKEDSVYEGFVQ